MTRIVFTLASLAAFATQTINANDFSNVRSGLLLGIYASPANGGMRVSSTIPGYSAEGRLYPGDILVRAAVPGGLVYDLRSNYEMENAKSAIGANREAGIEIWRPGQGYIYAWVEFTPIYAPTAAYTVSGAPQARSQAKASFRMETEKPGARQLFQNGRSNGSVPQNQASSQPSRSNSSRNPASLFN